MTLFIMSMLCGAVITCVVESLVCLFREKLKPHQLALGACLWAMLMWAVVLVKWRNLLTLVLVGSLLIQPIQARADADTCTITRTNAPGCTVIECGAAIVVLGTGILMLQAGCRMCNRIGSNINYQLTNAAPEPGFMPRLLAARECTVPMTIQAATGIGSAWVDGYQVSIQQTGDVVTGVVSSNGVPVATNSATMGAGGVVRLDFSTLPTPEGWRGKTFFRIAQ